MKRRHSKSVYEVIAEGLRDDLAIRKHAVGDRLPSLRELANRFNCSIATIQRAMALLRREGVLQSQDRKGVFVRAFPGSGLNRGRVMCLFPNWDWDEKQAFAAQYVIGVVASASAWGYAVEMFPYLSLDDILAMQSRVHDDRYAGVLWANPGAYALEEGLLAQLETSGIRVVTSIRHFPTFHLPYTKDDYGAGYAQAADLMFKRGVRRLGLLCNGIRDQTYEPALQVLLEALGKVGIKVAPDLVCRARSRDLDDGAREVLLRHFLAQRDRWDGCWAFAPDVVDDLRRIANTDQVDLGNRFMAVQTIRAAPTHGVHLVLESDIQAHGREAFKLLHEWIETGHRPTETHVPMVCSETRGP